MNKHQDNSLHPLCQTAAAPYYGLLQGHAAAGLTVLYPSLYSYLGSHHEKLPIIYANIRV